MRWRRRPRGNAATARIVETSHERRTLDTSSRRSLLVLQGHPRKEYCPLRIPEKDYAAGETPLLVCSVENLVAFF